MNVVEPVVRHIDVIWLGTFVPVYLGALAWSALPGPLQRIFSDARPDKFFFQQFGSCSATWMCQPMDDIESLAPEAVWNVWSHQATGNVTMNIMIIHFWVM